jgi:membrane protein implicated in regulation of membrane protease activity
LEDTVGIGGSIFLIAVGAILAFAVHVSVGWLSLNVVGYVLMFAGLAGLLLTLWFWSNRRRTVATTPVPVERERIVGERVVDEQRRVEYPPPESQY